MLARRVLGAATRRFHIDDAGHGDWRTEQEPRTVQIRFSCVPESMLDALHGLRAVERRFGRIRDYRLLRDSEIRSEYQAICWAAFESPSSLLRIPPHGMMLNVALPPPFGRPEGGPGLDDIKGLLIPGSRIGPSIPSFADELAEPARSIVLTVKRAGTEITFRSTVKPPYRSRAMKAAIGHGFLEWGGFAPLNPLYESSPFTSPAQEPPPLDSKNMRMALNKWSQILDVADPLFPEMKHSPPKAETRDHRDPDAEWEPLSEPHSMPKVEADATGDVTPQSLKQSLESLLQHSQEDSDVAGGADIAPSEKEKIS